MLEHKITYYPGSFVKKEVFYLDEKKLKQDKFIRYYLNGEICEVYYFVDNLMNGSYKRYNINGWQETDGEYKNNKKEGKWMKFNEDGSIIETKFYIFGKECDEMDYKKYIAIKRLNDI